MPCFTLHAGDPLSILSSPGKHRPAEPITARDPLIAGDCADASCATELLPENIQRPFGPQQPAVRMTADSAPNPTCGPKR
jgi:hypothetical protein